MAQIKCLIIARFQQNLLLLKSKDINVQKNAIYYDKTQRANFRDNPFMKQQIVL